MSLQETIKADLKDSMKARTEAKTSAIRVVMGEFGRQSKKELSDQEVIAIIKKLVKSEKETLEKSGQSTSDFLEIMESYLPRQASEAQIREWVENNIDFSRYNSKMQAMKPIMTHFGSSVDGKTVKRILEKM